MMLVLTGAAFAGPVAAESGPEHDLQNWTTVSINGAIDERFVYAAEANIRLRDDLSRVGQTLTRGSIGFRLTPELTVSQGFGHITQYRVGQRDLAEERLYQQINYTIGKLGAGTLSTRARLEQRFVRPGRDVGWRYRQQLRYAHPVGRRGASIVVQTEPFLALNSTDWGARAGFDQLRLMSGVNLPIGRKASVEFGYQAQYVRLPMRDRLNHVIPVALAFRL